MTTATTAIKATLKWLVTETPNQPPCWVKATTAVVALLVTYGILVYEFATEVWSLGVEGLYDLNDTLAEHWVSWWCPDYVKAVDPVKPTVEVTTKFVVKAVVKAIETVVVSEVSEVSEVSDVSEVATVETKLAEVAEVAEVKATAPAPTEILGEMVDIFSVSATPNRATRHRRSRTTK
jgi:hypothetical protein